MNSKKLTFILSSILFLIIFLFIFRGCVATPTPPINKKEKIIRKKIKQSEIKIEDNNKQIDSLISVINFLEGNINQNRIDRSFLIKNYTDKINQLKQTTPPECDTIYVIYDEKIDSIIYFYEKEINLFENIIIFKDSIIFFKDDNIFEQQKIINNLEQIILNEKNNNKKLKRKSNRRIIIAFIAGGIIGYLIK